MIFILVKKMKTFIKMILVIFKTGQKIKKSKLKMEIDKYIKSNKYN